MTTLSSKLMFMVFRLSFILILFAPIPSYAEVERKISINSQPVGAKVFLLRGRKQTLIGTTPFVYKATFHSNKSVIRMAFSKRGYEHHGLKVSASQKNINVSLKSSPLVEDPSSHKSPRHRKIQKKINSAIEPIIRALLEKPDLANVDSVEPIRVKQIGAQLYVDLSLSMIRPKGKLKGPSASRHEKVVKKLWGQLGKPLLLPLAKKVRGIDDIDGVLMEVSFNSQYTSFNVSHKVETTNETKCVPGNRYEQGSDFYGKPFTRIIYDPCLYRKTETITKLKFNPAVDRKRGKSIIQYYFTFKEMEKKHPKNNLFEKIGVKYTNSKGKEVFRKGSLPTEIK